MKNRDIKLLEKIIKKFEKGEIDEKGLLAIWVIAKFNSLIELKPKNAGNEFYDFIAELEKKGLI